jgi:hypothetical protein
MKVRQPTRMTQWQRNRQAEQQRFDPMLVRLGIHVDAQIVDDDENSDGAAGQTEAEAEPLTYPGGHEPSGVREATAYERAILGALQQKPVYEGTVAADVIAARRRRNKLARRARRANRAAAVWLMLFSVLFGAAVHYSIPAHAFDGSLPVTVSVGWSDSALCVDLVEPDITTRRTTLVDTFTCDSRRAVAIGYVSRPGQFYGVAVSASTPGTGVACVVEIAGRVVAHLAAVGAVDCLQRWSP